jgi:hypothetical protein
VGTNDCYQYLAKSPRALVQYIACNAMPKGYYYYSTAYIPADKDPLLVDAKMIMTYETHLPKWTISRRKKAGIASVKYLRCGRLILLIATKGKSPFFQREAFDTVWRRRLVIGGYSLTANEKTGKVSVRLHLETQRRIKRYILEWAWKQSKAWWEEWLRDFPFLPFDGVRDDLFALIRFLNANRKSFRKEMVEWKGNVKKTFTPEPVFLPTPPEILELIKAEKKR